nr:BspA family leucine-rich repeat surface protein [Mycoplasmopsis bovis]
MKEFNQDISSWDLSGVYNTSLMFYKAKKFNQDITKWNTANVTNMRRMFYGTKAYDKDLSNFKCFICQRCFGLCKSKLKKNEQKKNNQSSMMEHY